MGIADFLGGEQSSTIDPLDLLRSIAGAQPANAIGTPVSPIAPPPLVHGPTKALPPAPPPPGLLTNGVHPDAQGMDWKALLEQVGPLLAGFAQGNPQARAGWMQGWFNGQGLAKQEQDKRAAIEQQRKQASANFRLDVGQHAMGITDPVQRAQFVDLAEKSGVDGGFLKAGDLADLRLVPAGQANAAKVLEINGQLDALDKAGYNLDDLAKGGSHIQLKDGSQVPISLALDLTRRRPTDVNGNPVVKPEKAGSTEEERYIAKYAKERGTTVDALTTAQEKAARAEFRQAGQLPPRVDPSSVAAQYNDLVDIWKSQNPGKEPPAAVRTKLRSQANTVNDKPPSGAQAGDLTPEGLDYEATKYRVTGVMTPLGMGNAKVRTSIINTAAAQAKALGQAPAAAIQKQAAYKADGAALTKMTQMGSAAEAFETKALQQADIVEGLSNKVDRTQYPIINDALLAGKARIAGDQNTQLLYNSLATFTTEYAKIMEGSTGSSSASSDSARRSAASLISAGLNKGTLSATLDLMRREMRLTIQGYDATKQHITERMGGQTGGNDTSSTAPIKVGGFTVTVK